MQIKICGITNEADALHAVHSGATHLGMIFVEGSPRCVPLTNAAKIVQAVGGKAIVVGVFQNHEAESIARFVVEAGLDVIQLHGSEDAAFCRSIALRLGRQVIKTILLQEDEESNALKNSICEYADALGPGAMILFDRAKGHAGKDWLASALAQINALEKDNADLPPYFFAGGLTASNLKQVLETIEPYGLDVASGVEKSAGLKDPELVKSFIKSARESDKVLRSK